METLNLAKSMTAISILIDQTHILYSLLAPIANAEKAFFFQYSRESGCDGCHNYLISLLQENMRGQRGTLPVMAL